MSERALEVVSIAAMVKVLGVKGGRGERSDMRQGRASAEQVRSRTTSARSARLPEGDHLYLPPCSHGLYEEVGGGQTRIASEKGDRNHTENAHEVLSFVQLLLDPSVSALDCRLLLAINTQRILVHGIHNGNQLLKACVWDTVHQGTAPRAGHCGLEVVEELDEWANGEEGRTVDTCE